MPLIDPTLLKTRLGPLAGRFDVDALTECDSTSSELMRRASAGAPAGSVIVADRQTAGRGRRGRAWLSEPEASLTFSLLWRFPGPAMTLSGLSLAIGIALARALENLGASGIRLKWPNDLLLVQDGREAKLAGILIELSSDRRGTQAVIGIGLNLQPPATEFPHPVAGLSQTLTPLPERHVLLAAILGALLVVLEEFTVNGFRSLKNEWEMRHAWQGKPVQLLGETPAIQGVCKGVADDGSLLIETGQGIERIMAGDLSLRRS